MNFNPMDLITGGIIVIFLTQQAKRWIPSDFLPIVAVVLGVAVQLVNDWALATEPLTRSDWWVTIITGIGVGMVAGGFYDLAGRTGQVPPAQIQVDDSWLAADAEPTERTVDLEEPVGARTFDEWESLRNRKDL